MNITREEIDEVLYESMSAIFQFDRLKVLLFNMTYQDSYLLYFIRKQGQTRMNEIANEMNIHISTASRAIEKLEKRKLVVRLKDRNDRRNILVSLAPAGAMLMKASEDHSFYTIQAGLASFTDEEVMTIIKAAKMLNRILGVPSVNTKP
jgi:DNA-binding MarR family transcriptional regulator